MRDVVCQTAAKAKGPSRGDRRATRRPHGPGMAEAAAVPAAQRRTAVAAELGLDAVRARAPAPPRPRAPPRDAGGHLRGAPPLQPGLEALGGARGDRVQARPVPLDVSSVTVFPACPNVPMRSSINATATGP